MKTIYDKALELHAKHKGKLGVVSKVPLKNAQDLSMAYTPGVAQVCREIAKNSELAYDYTIKGNSVAVITDGSACLGLGNVGGLASLPVMEGKAMLMRELAGIDAYPLCFQNSDSGVPALVNAIKLIAPQFGGINLEDIAAPKCFEVEEALQELGIPVMHDDQHGTAIAILAALLNACKVAGKKIENLTITINGAGAAGTAIVRMLRCLEMDTSYCSRVKEIFVCDSKGIIHRGREDLWANRWKYIISQETNHEKRKGGLKEALKGSDVFIGVSKGGLLPPEYLKTMAKKPFVLSLANPDPEIMPDAARKAGAYIVGTGRSDLPNQINNALAFPGIFRGCLDCRAKTITHRMKIAAAHAIAGCVPKPTVDRIVPSVFEKNVVKCVADAVKKAAKEDGVARV